MSKADFARLVGVSDAAISKAITKGRVVETGNGVHAMIDTDFRVNAFYIAHQSDQRRTGAREKARRLLEAQRSEVPDFASMKPGYARCASIIEHFWPLGVLPTGWSHIDLKDVFETDGRRTPLLFYPPNDEPGCEFGVETEALKDYAIDLDAEPFAVATDRAGGKHRVVLTTHGHVPWLEDSEIGGSSATEANRKGKSMKSDRRVGEEAGSSRKKPKETRAVGKPYQKARSAKQEAR